MLTVFSRNRERICWYVVNGSRALEVPAVYGRIFYIIPVLGQPAIVFLSLELALDDELIQEGVARDVIRNIQDARKQLGCDITERINLSVKPMQQSWIDVICAETLADIQDIGIADIEFEVKNDYGNGVYVKICRKTKR